MSVRESVTAGVIGALLTSGIFSILNWGWIQFRIIGIPSGAIVAFNEDDCPVDGWSEYKPAYGRFLRGIDKDAKTDPDGTRHAGAPQDDQFKAHEHAYIDSRAELPAGIHAGEVRSNPGHNIDREGMTAAVGGEETRPKNVAVLYCVKN